jgi:hypothetical protein
LPPDTRQNGVGFRQKPPSTFLTTAGSAENAGVSAFVGRTEPLARLTAAHRAVVQPPGAASADWTGLVLVTGEAGMGKTALLNQFARRVTDDGGSVAWGTCWDGDQAPAWWPWTQVLRVLLEQHGDVLEVQPELAAIVPELARDRSLTSADTDVAARSRVFDAVGQLLRRVGTEAPLVVILDDLHRADRSSVDLLTFLAHQGQPGQLMLVGAYRADELTREIAPSLADLACAAELVPLPGLTAAEVAELVHALAGVAVEEHWARLVHERSGGHPFYARELCRLLVATGSATDVPAAVREVIGRRLTRLSPECLALLNVAAVAGSDLSPDVLAEVVGDDPARVLALAGEATTAGIFGPAGFVHDLYRETIYAGLSPQRRLELHHGVGMALEHRKERGGVVFAAEVAHHYAAAIPAADPVRAMQWAQSAASEDAARCAFTEAAGHLTRLRSAVADAGQALSDSDQVRLLAAEADLWLRAGDAGRARALLDAAWTCATADGHAELLGAVALGLDRIDARFAMPRTDLVSVLDTARGALSGSGTPLEAMVTAALARQLQHSVPADRPRARPLADEAVRLARTLDDPATLAGCLLAQHDSRWTPGTATARTIIAAEIADLARQAGDEERHAQALLLSATAQLENASPAFRATLTEYAYLSERLRQPRHDYLLRTRRAALALLDGDIETGERLSAEAAALGDRIGDNDAGNVRMSQRLEIVRSRGRPPELRAMAVEAVQWWVGAPAHAHAVAAGFSARAGDLDRARRELDTVLELDDWRTDRSYLWSVFVGEMAHAAIAVRDQRLCRQLIDDLLPLAETCAVNAALVCFMGAHAHRVGLLYAALDRPEQARHWLHGAALIHRRLGARAWEAETERALASLDEPVPTAAAALRRVGDMWEATYHGSTVYLRDVKGLHDLATLLAHPGADLAALTLAGDAGGDRSGADPVLDRIALRAYRGRLAELDDELATAAAHDDLARRRRATDERERLLIELRRATRPDGSPRALANTVAERARKAVTARIRDAIRRIGDAHPDFGAHLDRAVRTGTTCSYSPE